MSLTTSYIVQNDKDFSAGLDRLARLTQDFRVPFYLIANDFYKSEKQIFQLKSAGRYPELAQSTIDMKERKLGPGNAWPILFLTGRLAKSLLSRDGTESVFEVTKTSMEMGTDVPYAIFHQSDKARTKLPQRKPIFIDGGPMDAPGAKNGRRARWLNILNDYVLKIINGEVK